MTNRIWIPLTLLLWQFLYGINIIPYWYMLGITLVGIVVLILDEISRLIKIKRAIDKVVNEEVIIDKTDPIDGFKRIKNLSTKAWLDKDLIEIVFRRINNICKTYID